MKKGIAVVMAFALVALFVTGCSTDTSPTPPMGGSDGGDVPAPSALESIDEAVITEDDSVQIGELI
jgi:hypothetical protein